MPETELSLDNFTRLEGCVKGSYLGGEKRIGIGRAGDLVLVTKVIAAQSTIL